MSILTSILRGVSPVAQVAGDVVQGLNVDRQNAVTAALAQRRQAEDEKRTALLNQLTGAQITKLTAPPPPKRERVGGQIVDLDAGKATPIEGFTEPAKPPQYRVENGQRINLETNTAEPIEGYKPPEPPKPNLSFQTVTPGEGQAPVIIGVDPKTGQKVSEVGMAKPTGSAAKLTGDQEKSYLFYNLMKNAEPQITAALATGRIRPAAVQAYLSAGSAAEIPIVGKAIGALAQPVANANLNEDEQKMIRAGKDFAAGVLRKESGAAVTNSELTEVMNRYFPGMFGDKPGLTSDKETARKQYMHTMEEEAGPAIQFYGRRNAGANPPAAPSPSGVPSFEEWLRKQEGTPDA